MINKELVAGKLSDMEGYYNEMSELLLEDARVILKNTVKLRAVERLFQLIVDTSIDINTHIIAESEFHLEDDYKSTFLTLGEHNILPIDFARKIAPSVGLRNLVVHKYGKVDLVLMIEQIKSEMSNYKEYIKQIHDFLNLTENE